MFVLKSTHKKLQQQYRELNTRLAAATAEARCLNGQVMTLVRKLQTAEAENRAFRQHAAILPVRQQFTSDEIQSLIGLCHPDKHGGKQAAVDLMAKLLAMRART